MEEKKKENKRLLRKIGNEFLALITGFFTGYLLFSYIPDMLLTSRVIPNRKDVQQGYVVPSKLEVYLNDSDFNGEVKTIMNYDDKEYLLRDINGKLIV